MNTPALFHSAIYTYAPAFDGWHIRTPENEPHRMCPQQILLHEPLRSDPFGAIHTAANGRNPSRYEWWVEWNKASSGLYYAYERQPEGAYLLVFQQPQVGHTEPFRLLVFAVNEALPKPLELWPYVRKMLTGLPAVREQALSQ